MKKVFTFFLSLMAVVSASAQFVLTYGDNVVTKDTTITINEAVEDPISGEVVMDFRGSVGNVSKLSVTITRPSADLSDQFCAAGKCNSSNEELTQTLSFSISDPVADWYAHFMPTVIGDYQYTYVFADAERTLTIRVIYHYTGANLQRAILTNQFSVSGSMLTWKFDTSFARNFALYNALGKRLCNVPATSTEGSYDLSAYPHGLYILTLNEGSNIIATKKVIIR